MFSVKCYTLLLRFWECCTFNKVSNQINPRHTDISPQKINAIKKNTDIPSVKTMKKLCPGDFILGWRWKN